MSSAHGPSVLDRFCVSGRDKETRGPAPSLPDWRVALWTALLAVELAALPFVFLVWGL